MKTMKKPIIVVKILFALCSTTLFAKEPPLLTAQEWLVKYQSDSPAEQVEALGQVIPWFIQANGESHCAPTNATAGQAAAITEKYLKENPEVWNENSNTMILVSLRLAWPCSKALKTK